MSSAARRAAAWGSALAARVLDAVRALLGPHPTVAADLAHTRADLAAAQRRLVEQAARHRSSLAAAQERVDAAVRHERGAQRALWAAYEPPTDGVCIKARLRDEAEATAYARRVEQETGAPAGALAGYRCRVCPRQPLTSDRFWHIHNVDPAMRSGRPGTQAARTARMAAVSRDAVRSGRTIGQRVARPGSAP